MRHEHRDRCVGADMLRDAANEEFAQAAVTVTTHHEEVCLRLLRMFEKHLAHGATACIDKMHIGNDAVKREVICERGAGARLKLLAADTKDGDVLCPFQ